MIHLNYAGLRQSFDVERTQIVAANNGVFLRVSTRPEFITPDYYAPIRESSRRVENRWQIDGVNFNLSCRNVEFAIIQRRPQLITQLIIDLYMPLNQAIDISFQQYTPSEGAFSTPFADTAAIAQRQTGAYPTAGPRGVQRTHRPVRATQIPRQMRELVDQDLYAQEGQEMAEPNAATLNAPLPTVVVPDITEVPAAPAEANFLRRFDNIVTDDGTDEQTPITCDGKN